VGFGDLGSHTAAGRRRGGAPADAAPGAAANFSVSGAP